MDKKKQITQIIYNIAKGSVGLDDRIVARAIGTVLFDVPTTRSGMVSSALLDEYGYRPAVKDCCEEHFHSRQNSGYRIIQMIRDGANVLDIEEFINEATMVHLTTSSENTRLSAIQNHESTRDIGWKAQYKLAGIKLVRDPGTMPRRLKKVLTK